MKNQSGKLFIKIIIAAALLALAISPFTHAAMPAVAQSDGWSKAVNLSNMGSSSNPAVVIDESGTIHALWYDEFAGNMYSSSQDGVEWSEPISAAVPFEEVLPFLIQGPENSIHAFWIDNRGSLITSSIESNRIGNVSVWKANRTLALSVSSFHVVKDSGGFLYVGFIRNEDIESGKAGAYFLKSTKNGLDWMPVATLLYSSPYFRGEETGGKNISVSASASGESTTVFVSWDEGPRGKIFLSRSIDGGATWGEVTEIDRPESQLSFAVPKKLKVYSWNDQTLLIWEKGGQEGDCSHLFQVSTDEGETWSPAGNIIPNPSACSTSSGIAASTPEMFVYSLMINGQASFIAWNGVKWSEPQLENGLMYIQDPETTQQISLGCQQTAFQPSKNLIAAIGCDLGPRNDIWYTSLELGDLSSWFLSEDTWQRPVDVFDVPGGSSSTQLMADSQGNFYALWIQADPPSPSDAGSQPRRQIYFSGRIDDAWFPPGRVLQSLEGDVDLMTAAIVPDGTVMVAWWGEQARELYFSRAPLDRAFVSREWLEPVLLPISAGNCASIDMVIGPSGEIYVVYSVAFNEARGVYLTRSEDGGRAWSDPVLIFDGNADLWDRVGEAEIAVAANGDLHVVWYRQSISQEDLGLGMYYARSEDRGETWSPVETVLDGGVLWGDLVETSTGLLYRVWQEPAIRQTVISSQVSLDGGATWEPTLTVTNTAEALLRFSLVADRSGRIHLLQLAKAQTGSVNLLHWITGETTWTSGESLTVNDSGIFLAESMAGAISSQGQLALLFSLTRQAADGTTAPGVMSFTERQIDDPAVEPTQPAVEQAPTLALETPAAPDEGIPTLVLETPAPAEPTPASTPAFQASPTPELVDFSQEPSSAAENPWIGVVIGIVLSSLIIGVVFGFSIIKSRKLVRNNRKYRG